MKTETVMMPTKLTAENGAKKLMIGEFKENVIISCNECNGEGHYDDGSTCLECTGAGNFSVSAPVQWTTIKEIYAMAVKHLAIRR